LVAPKGPALCEQQSLLAANEEKELSLCSARQKRLYEQILIYFVELIEN
jgi:hypothetical protein